MDALARQRPFRQASSRVRAEYAVSRAILRTLVYADLFEYPLTRSEVQRYLVGATATAPTLAATLTGDPGLRQYVEQTADWLHLAGRSHLAELRRERATASARLWPVARRYGVRIARLPFVRLVAVTGALAMNNARPGDDIDLFILVQPGRLWLCRLLVLGVVKLAARRGYELCPNFLLSTDHLRLSERNLFTAHEVAQMVPLEPTPWFGAFLQANGWVRAFLPNVMLDVASDASVATVSPGANGVLEGVLSRRLFDRVERWEMTRKVRRLTARHQREGGSVAFTAHECRGHFAAHDQRVLAAYRTGCARHADALS